MIKTWLKNSIDGYSHVFTNNEYLRLFILSMLTSLFAAMSAPIFPLWLVLEVGVSASSVFFILAISGLGTSVINLYIGHLTDIIGKRKLIVEISFFLLSVRGFLYYFFPYVGVVIGASWLTQISNTSIIFAMLTEAIEHNNDENKQGLIISTVRTAVSIGYIIGPWLGITIANYSSYSLFFLIFGVANLFLLWFTKKFLKYSKIAENKKIKGSFPINRSNIGFVLGSSLLIILLFSGSLTSGPLLALYVDELSIAWAVAAVFGVGPIFEIIVFPLVGVLSDKIGTIKTIILGAIGEVLYFLLLTMVDNIYGILLIQIFGTFYTAVLFTSVMIFVQDKIGGKQLGFSSSLYFSSMTVAGIVSNALLGSILKVWAYKIGFVLLAVMACAGLIVIISMLYFRKEPSFEIQN